MLVLALRLRLIALLFLTVGSASAQEALEDQDPVDLDWVPAWDTPFWPAPSGAALEIAAGRTGSHLPATGAGVGQIASGDYLLALLTLPLGAPPRPSSPSTSDAGRSDEAASEEDGDQTERAERPRPMNANAGAQPTGTARPVALGPATSSEGPAPPREASPPAVEAPRGPATGGEVPLELVREAIERAETAAGFMAALHRIASVGQRARWSGLAPELRLRGATGIDQTRSIDSAGVVPSDETQRDGSDSLVEVRLTFHLERLLHSGQEVALERARQQLQSERAELRALIGQELVTYARALRRSRDESLDDEEREKLGFAAESARLSLFLLTDGWFRGEETLERYERRETMPLRSVR